MSIETGKYYIIDGRTICICDYADGFVYTFSYVDGDGIFTIFANEVSDYVIEEW